MKSDPIKILIVHSAIEATGNRGGGIQNAVLAQAIGLQAIGIDVQLLTSSHDCARAARLHGIPVHLNACWHSGINPLLSLDAWKVALSGARRPTAVIHNGGRTWLCMPVLYPLAVHAQVLHREVLYPYRFFINWISLSRTYAAHLKGTASGRLRRIAVAPNGLLEHPPAPVKAPNDETLIIGTTGRLGDWKGTDILIDAARITSRHAARVKYKVVGPGADVYSEIAAKEGLNDVIQFENWTNDISGWLDGIDVFCSPSRREPFGIAIIEAMARGRPIVATSTNGAKDIVEEGVSGWLVPIGSSEALASKIMEIERNRDHVTRCGQNAYMAAIENYSPVAVGSALKRALRELGVRIPDTQPTSSLHSEPNKRETR